MSPPGHRGPGHVHQSRGAFLNPQKRKRNRAPLEGERGVPLLRKHGANGQRGTRHVGVRRKAELEAGRSSRELQRARAEGESDRFPETRDSPSHRVDPDVGALPNPVAEQRSNGRHLDPQGVEVRHRHERSRGVDGSRRLGSAASDRGRAWLRRASGVERGRFAVRGLFGAGDVDRKGRCTRTDDGPGAIDLSRGLRHDDVPKAESHPSLGSLPAQACAIPDQADALEFDLGPVRFARLPVNGHPVDGDVWRFPRGITTRARIRRGQSTPGSDLVA